MPIQINSECSGVSSYPFLPVVLVLVGSIGFLGPVCMLAQTSKKERDGRVFSISKVIRFPGAKFFAQLGIVMCMLYTSLCFPPLQAAFWVSLLSGVAVLLISLINGESSDPREMLVAKIHMYIAGFWFVCELVILAILLGLSPFEGYDGRYTAYLVMFIVFCVSGVAMYFSTTTGKGWTSWTSAWEWFYEICFLVCLGLIPGVVL